jgi:hypothetical protein
MSTVEMIRPEQIEPGQEWVGRRTKRRVRVMDDRGNDVTVLDIDARGSHVRPFRISRAGLIDAYWFDTATASDRLLRELRAMGW